MTKQRVQDWWNTVKAGYMRFFGIEEPADERIVRVAENDAAYWRGFDAGQRAMWPLVKLLARQHEDGWDRLLADTIPETYRR